MGARNLIDRNRAHCYLSTRRQAEHCRREASRLRGETGRHLFGAEWCAEEAKRFDQYAARAQQWADRIEATKPTWTRFLFEVQA